MNQRRPKLGDILDDYCPRERRLTNHAIVAMVEDEVKLTRCTTCDTEHEFKHGKMPTLRRKKDVVSTAYKEVLAAVTGETTGRRRSRRPLAPPPEPAVKEAALPAPAVVLQADEPQASAERPGGRESPPRARREARAPPRTAGSIAASSARRCPGRKNHVPDRPVPEFTMHQPADRGGKFRGGAGRGMGGRHSGGRGGGPHGGQPRGPVFGRPSGDRGGPHGGRVPGRSDAHGPHRGGQPRRPGKKHSR